MLNVELDCSVPQPLDKKFVILHYKSTNTNMCITMIVLNLVKSIGMLSNELKSCAGIHITQFVHILYLSRYNNINFTKTNIEEGIFVYL